MANSKTNKQSTPTGSHLGFEATLWATTDKLRGNLDAVDERRAKPEKADCILANGSVSSNQSGAGEIRKAIIETGFVNCVSARGSLNGSNASRLAESPNSVYNLEMTQ